MIPEIQIDLKAVAVDAGSVNEIIDDLLKEKELDELNKHVPEDKFWCRPIKSQIEALSDQWTHPDSDGKGKIFYLWRNRSKNVPG